MKSAEDIRTRAITWGVIGTGAIVRERMVAAIRAAGGDVASILSRSPERAREAADALEIPDAHDDLARFLADDRVQAVYIASPNALHAAQTIAAAEAGRHVLCEKPIADGIDDALLMIQACREAGVRLGVNHYHRLKTTHASIKRAISAGAVGDVVAIRVALPISLPVSRSSWRLADAARGGVARDLLVHHADLLRYLLDDEIVDVIAFSSRREAAGAEDTALGVLRFSKGVLASFADSYLTPAAENGLDLYGTAGSIRARGVMRSTVEGTVTLTRDGKVEALDGEPEDHFVTAVRRFHDSIESGGEPAITGEDGARALAAALAARDSARERRAVRPANVDLLLSQHQACVSRARPDTRAERAKEKR